MTLPMEILHRDGDSAFALLAGRVILQARWGQLTLDTLERFGAIAVPRILPPTQGLFGSLMVVETSAVVPELAVRERQREFVQGWLTRENMRMAVVTIGDDVQATLKRAVSRVVVHRHPHLAHFSALNEGARWMVDQIPDAGLTIDALLLAHRSLVNDSPGAR
jgi:hypothetical protein